MKPFFPHAPRCFWIQLPSCSRRLALPQIWLQRWIKQQSLRQRAPYTLPGVIYSKASYLPGAEGSYNSRSYPGLSACRSQQHDAISFSQLPTKVGHLPLIDFLCLPLFCLQAKTHVSQCHYSLRGMEHGVFQWAVTGCIVTYKKHCNHY